MTFVYPYLIGLIIGVPILVTVYIFRSKDRQKIWQVFQSPHRWRETISFSSESGFFWRKTMVILAFIMLIFAAMRPQYGEQYQTIERDGRQIIFAVDVSLSMLAEDAQPNRLAAVKRHILQVLPEVSNDLVGIVPFSGSSFTFLPLTSDQSAAQLFVEDLSVGMIASSGTNLGALIALTQSMMGRKSQWQDPIIIVFTDGEFNPPIDDTTIATGASLLGPSPIFVGMGGKKPEPIPLRDSQNKVKDYKKDASGQIVLTKQESSVLEALANQWNGLYVDANQTPLVADTIYQYLQEKETRQLEEKQTITKIDRYHGFLIIAIILLLMDMIFPSLHQWLRHRGVWLLIIGYIMTNDAIAGHPGVDAYNNQDYAAAKTLFIESLNRHPNNGRIRYNLANTYVKKGDMKKAISLYEEAMAGLSNKEQMNALYNIGTAHMMNNQTDAAIHAYKQVLQLDPSHKHARQNLEFMLIQPKQSHQNKDNESQDASNDAHDSDHSPNDTQEPTDSLDGDQQSTANASMGAQDESKKDTLSEQQIRQLVNQAESDARKRKNNALTDYFYEDGW